MPSLWSLVKVERGSSNSEVQLWMLWTKLGWQKISRAWVFMHLEIWRVGCSVLTFGDIVVFQRNTNRNLLFMCGLYPIKWFYLVSLRGRGCSQALILIFCTTTEALWCDDKVLCQSHWHQQWSTGTLLDTPWLLGSFVSSISSLFIRRRISELQSFVVEMKGKGCISEGLWMCFQRQLNKAERPSRRIHFIVPFHMTECHTLGCGVRGPADPSAASDGPHLRI